MQKDDFKNKQHVLHVFDPAMKSHMPPHYEVDFQKGRYIDIANTKGKNPNTLYFGLSLTSNLLSGIFLGDLELTSRVKDVSLIPEEDGGVTISVKYVNDNNKLATVKSRLTTEKEIQELKKLVNEIKIFVDNLDERLTMLDSSVAILEGRADMIDTSLILLGNELDHGGMYDYTIHTDTGTFENGYKQTIKLFKGDEEQLDSSTIEIEDRVVRRLTYIEGSNDIVATIFPKAIPDSNITEFDPLEKLIVYNEDKSEGNTTQIERRVLPTEYVQNVSLNLDNYDKHINIVMNTDSSLRDRMVFVEDHLWWENLGNDPTHKL